MTIKKKKIRGQHTSGKLDYGDQDLQESILYSYEKHKYKRPGQL